MNEEHRNRLRRNRTKIVEDLDPERDVNDYLLENGIISDEDNEKICKQSTTKDKARELLNILPRKGENAFQVFLKALERTGLHHLVQLLEKEEESLTLAKQASRITMRIFCSGSGNKVSPAKEEADSVAPTRNTHGEDEEEEEDEHKTESHRDATSLKPEERRGSRIETESHRGATSLVPEERRGSRIETESHRGATSLVPEERRGSRIGTEIIRGLTFIENQAKKQRRRLTETETLRNAASLENEPEENTRRPEILRSYTVVEDQPQEQRRRVNGNIHVCCLESCKEFFPCCCSGTLCPVLCGFRLC